MTRNALEAELGLAPNQPFVIVSFHPVTQKNDLGDSEAQAMLAALRRWVKHHGHRLIFTGSNLDPGGARLDDLWRRFVEDCPQSVFFPSLGTRRYFSALRWGDCLVGNSSSGILEAASLGCPAINIGLRQRGRFHEANVLDVPGETDAILEALARALEPSFREGLRHLPNPYDRGGAAELIVNRLKGEALEDRLLIKRFYDLPGTLAMTGVEEGVYER